MGRNHGGCHENDVMSARLVDNYRDKYVNSTAAPSHHPTIPPSHHRTIAPSHHRTTAPSPPSNSQGLSVINGVAMPTAPPIAAGVSTLAFPVNYNIAKNMVRSFDAAKLLNTARAISLQPRSAARDQWRC